MINGEGDEKLESQLSEKSYNLIDYVEEKYYVCKNIFKIIVLCFCLIIIIIPSTKKIIDNPTNPITLPDQKNEPISKEEKEIKQENKVENKNNKEQNKEPLKKPEDKREPIKKTRRE